jgi:hypothetical protein
MLGSHSAKAKKAYSSSDLLGLVKHEPISRKRTSKRRIVRNMEAFEEEFEEEEPTHQPMAEIFSDRWQENITKSTINH